MGGLVEFQKRMAADAGRIHWRPEHYPTLAKVYKISEEQVAKAVTPAPVVSSFPEAVTKSAQADVQRSFKWTMNDGLVDLAGDIVVAAGVDTTHFRRNPIALLQHAPGQPIGTWSGVHVDGSALKGTLNLAPTSLGEYVRENISHNVLKGASLGFIPRDFEPMAGGGFRFLKSEILECSCVSIPASRGSLRERSREECKADRREEVAQLQAKSVQWRHEAEAEEASRKREAAQKRDRVERLKQEILAEAEARRRAKLSPEEKRRERIADIRRIAGDDAAFAAEQRMLRQEYGYGRD